MLAVLGGVVLLAVAARFILPALEKPPVVKTALVVADAGGPNSVRTEVLTANGYVVPRLKASVSSEVGGRLAALYVEEGDTAAAGQVLGMLRNDDYKAQIRSDEARLAAARADRARAEARLTLAQQEFDRQKDLLARKIASQAAYDLAEASLKVARADVDAAAAAVNTAAAALQVSQELLEKTYIRAPFDGTVVRKEAEVGEIVSPLPANGGLTRGAIVTMADLKSSEMVVDVNEGYVTRVSPDQPAEIELDAYAGVRFPARVRQVVPTADRQKATVQVKVAFDQPDRRILPEMGGKVYFLADPRAAAGGDGAAAGAAGSVLAPRAAVRQVNGRSVVWVVKDGRVRMQPVQVIGAAGDAQVRIGAGMLGGETVVIDGPEKLKDGGKVKS